MRFVYERGSQPEQDAVQRRMAELAQPEAALALIRRLPQAGAPVRARCIPLRFARDRYVIHVQTECADGVGRAFVLKGYGDQRGARLAGLYGVLGRWWERRGEPCPVVRPLRYFAQERAFVLPWVDGLSMAEAIARGRTDLVQHAIGELPRVLARLHATPVVPEAATAPERMLELAAAHWEQDYPRRFGEARRTVIEPLLQSLRAALARLDPAAPALIHGDTGPGNFLFDGSQWRMLDLDTFGYADPAYDVGYLLAKLENHCLAQPVLAPHAAALMHTLRAACLQAAPGLSARNVAFYYGLTLSRKTLAQVLRALPRAELGRFPQAAAPILRRIRAALEEPVTQ